MASDTTEELLIRFVGDASGYLRTLRETLTATRNAASGIGREVSSLSDQAGRAAEAAAQATDEAADAERDRIKQMKEAIKVTKELRTETERYKDRLAQLARLRDEGLITRETYSRGVVAANKERFSPRQQDVHRAGEVTQMVRTPMETYNASIREYKDLLGKSLLTQEMFNRSVRHARVEYLETAYGLRTLSKSTLHYGTALTALGASYLVMKGGKRSIELAAEAESLRASFSTMLKSKQLGNQMVADIQKVAQETPLLQTSLQRDARTLLQYGISYNKVIPLLKQIGDVTGADADRMHHMALAFGQAAGEGRLMGQDLIQMVNAGFNPLKEMARTTGRSFAELNADMHDGKITIKMLEDAFKSATSEGGQFYNLMVEQSKTLKGAWTNAKDDVDAALREIGTTLVTEFKIKELVKGLSQSAKAVVEWTRTVTPQTLALVRVIGYLVVGFGALAVVIVASMIAGKAWTITVGIMSVMATGLTARMALLSLAAGGLKLALAAVVIVGTKMFYDMATNADRTRREMERTAEAVKRVKDRVEEMGNKDVKQLMMLPNIDEQVEQSKKLLDQYEQRLKGMPDRIPQLEKTIQENAAKLIGSTNPTDAARFRERMNAAKVALAELKEEIRSTSAERDKIRLLSEDLAMMQNASGQLALKLKEARDELKETINFSGLDKYQKQILELHLLMDKLKTDDNIRYRTISEVYDLQRIARQKELNAAIGEYLDMINKDGRYAGKTEDERHLLDFFTKIRGTTPRNSEILQIINTQKEVARLKDIGRLRDEGRKLMDEYMDPLERYKREASELKEMFDRGFINQTALDKGMTAAVNKFNEATGAAERLREALDGIQASAFKSADALAKMRSFKEQFSMRAPVAFGDLRYQMDTRNQEWMKAYENLVPEPRPVTAEQMWKNSELRKWLDNEPSGPAPAKSLPNVALPAAPEVPRFRADVAPMPREKIIPRFFDDPADRDKLWERLVPKQGRGPDQNDDRKEIITLLTRIAQSNEEMQKKPSVVLKTANL